MSTGIGNHKISRGGENPYNPPIAICPYCECKDCEADFCDVGVGMVQCGPYHCPACNASEASSRDTRELTAKEKETGWYEPNTPVSEIANQLNGQLIDHGTAKILQAFAAPQVPSTLSENKVGHPDYHDALDAEEHF